MKFGSKVAKSPLATLVLAHPQPEEDFWGIHLIVWHLNKTAVFSGFYHKKFRFALSRLPVIFRSLRYCVLFHSPFLRFPPQFLLFWCLYFECLEFCLLTYLCKSLSNYYWTVQPNTCCRSGEKLTSYKKVLSMSIFRILLECIWHSCESHC